MDIDNIKKKILERDTCLTDFRNRDRVNIF